MSLLPFPVLRDKSNHFVALKHATGNIVPLLAWQVAREARTVPPEGASETDLERHRLAKIVDGLIDRKV